MKRTTPLCLNECWLNGWRLFSKKVSCPASVRAGSCPDVFKAKEGVVAKGCNHIFHVSTHFHLHGVFFMSAPWVDGGHHGNPAPHDVPQPFAWCSFSSEAAHGGKK